VRQRALRSGATLDNEHGQSTDRANRNERPIAFPRLHLPEQLTNRETS
jgi:hypothetical protein